jgi:molybdenum cofactor cytidylyltransferase
MGSPKQTALIDGRPLLTIVVETALTVCSRCIVVTGANREATRSAIPARPEVVEVYNAYHDRGMISSISVGAEQVESAWFFVSPGDMPRLSPDVYGVLADAAARYESGRGPAAFFPTYQGRRGHPVLISRRVVPDLQHRVEEFRSMRDFLSRYDVAEIAVTDDGILLDIDTPADAKSAEHSRGKRHE